MHDTRQGVGERSTCLVFHQKTQECRLSVSNVLWLKQNIQKCLKQHRTTYPHSSQGKHVRSWRSTWTGRDNSCLSWNDGWIGCRNSRPGSDVKQLGILSARWWSSWIPTAREHWPSRRVPPLPWDPPFKHVHLPPPHHSCTDLEDVCWSWSSNTLATWSEEPTHCKRPWCWETLKAEGEVGDRGRDGWMASPTQWAWIWATLGDGEGQGSLACCSPWSWKRVGYD